MENRISQTAMRWRGMGGGGSHNRKGNLRGWRGVGGSSSMGKSKGASSERPLTPSEQLAHQVNYERYSITASQIRKSATFNPIRLMV
ncbi:hypothetical protein CDAR_620551 [Caerostris darwini]|uniref:Uncharacterized protein n=1 Tax=Caerostris darwini TaxID=1538125 RepID=A0AAV4PUV4_9ARAC|nr:hypothetical protein CDAR_620551 [Caerostris darwini]